LSCGIVGELFVDARMATELTAAELAQRLGAELGGDVAQAGRLIRSVGPVKAAGPEQVTFVTDDKHKAQLPGSGAGALITAEACEGFAGPQLLVKDVDAALIEALTIFAPQLEGPEPGVDPTARLGRDVVIGAGASIGPHVVIEDGVRIGSNTVIGSGCRIGQNSVIGSDGRLDSNVVVYHNCRLGSHVIIQANTVIGSTGFGYSFIDGSHRLIPHNGGVVIEDFVELGANCCVDRAKFGNTVIGAGTKIDNLVQVAHNVVMGKCCLVAALVGISGSCELGDGVVLGGQVGLADNISIGSGVMVAAKSGVVSDVEPGKKLAWTPAIERREALRIVNLVMRLPEFAKQLKQLSKRVEGLEAPEDDKE